MTAASDFDTVSLHGRRADQRWNRICVGDITERMTWSRPDELAIVGWEGAYSAPEFAALTWRQADQLANRVANMLRSHGLQRGDRADERLPGGEDDVPQHGIGVLGAG